MSNKLLIEKLKKNTRIKETEILTESEVYGNKRQIPTDYPMLNVALSGSVDGGFTPGLGVLAGPSKHFKTGFCLVMARTFLEDDPDAIILFYDSEFGTPPEYYTSLGVDMSRVVHTPITNVEELKFDLVQQLEGLTKSDKIMIVIDSVGNLASKKEVEDALDARSVADMSRAKAIKSLFRIITPYLSLKDIPMMVVNHTYKEQGMYPRDIVSGGTGIYYSADWIWILGRQQNKKSDQIKGYHFIINIEKSRLVREKVKIPISITFEEGIMKYSGLLEVAIAGQYVEKPSAGWYQVVDQETGELIGPKYREDDIFNNPEVWEPMLENTDFSNYINRLFAISPKNGKKIEETFDPEEV